VGFFAGGSAIIVRSRRIRDLTTHGFQPRRKTTWGRKGSFDCAFDWQGESKRSAQDDKILVES
jgi:hypothetical protein